jgi:hypothetical protein
VCRIGLVALLTFLVVQTYASETQPIVAQADPRVVLRIDPKTGRRQVQLTGRSTPAYPTVDITCDGKTRTFTLTRSEFIKNRTTAIYAVPEDHAGRMLKAVECRLLTPGRDIALSRQQLRVWASPSQGTAH